MSKERTLEEFIEDKISDGRSLKYILAVAHSSRWRDKKKEIEEFFNNFQKNLKKINAKPR